MSVVVSNEEVGPWRRQVKVEVPADAVAAEVRKVVGEYRKVANIPGFRKGKVPASLLHRRFRREIDEEVQEKLMQRYWLKAQKEAGLELLLPPRVQDVEHEPGGPLTFVAGVEVRPEIKLGELAGFDLPEGTSEPSEDEIDAAIDDLRRSWGSWKAADRPAAQGDRIHGRLLAEGDEPEDEADEEDDDGEKAAAGRPVHFEIGHSGVWEELSLAATGAVAGREVEFSRKEEGEDGMVETKYLLHVEEVEELEMPELDDELASRVAGVDSVDEMRSRIREEIQRGKQSQARRQRETALLQQLRDRHPMELPGWVVDEEVRRMMTDYAEELARQGIDVENVSLDWDAISAEARPEAERRVHDRLLLDAVGEAEKIEVPEEEVAAFIMAIARSQRRSPQELQRELAEAGKLEALRAQLRRQRTVRQLLGELEDDEEATAEATAESDSGNPEEAAAAVGEEE